MQDILDTPVYILSVYLCPFFRCFISRSKHTYILFPSVLLSSSLHHSKLDLNGNVHCLAISFHYWKPMLITFKNSYILRFLQQVSPPDSLSLRDQKAVYWGFLLKFLYVHVMDLSESSFKSANFWLAHPAFIPNLCCI